MPSSNVIEEENEKIAKTNAKYQGQRATSDPLRRLATGPDSTESYEDVLTDRVLLSLKKN